MHNQDEFEERLDVFCWLHKHQNMLTLSTNQKLIGNTMTENLEIEACFQLPTRSCLNFCDWILLFCSLLNLSGCSEKTMRLSDTKVCSLTRIVEEVIPFNHMRMENFFCFIKFSGLTVSSTILLFYVGFLIG